jgi:hypothetical protein
MIVGAQPTDVRVVETRRPNDGESADSCHVEISRGPVAVQLFGRLSDLQLVVVEIIDGLTKIGQARGMEGRRPSTGSPSSSSGSPRSSRCSRR